MASLPYPARPVKPGRTARILEREEGRVAGVLQISDGGRTDRYAYCATGAGAFIMTKVEAAGCYPKATYRVTLDGDDSRCECKSAAYRGTCRHIDVLMALGDKGKL